MEIKDNLTRGRDFSVQLIHAKAHQTLANAEWKVICPPEFGTARLNPNAAKVSGAVETLLSINPTVSVGRFTFDLVFEAKAEQQDQPVVCSLPVVGHVSDTVALLPSILVFGAGPIGEMKSDFVSVKGPGT
ncbi:MAG: hypothetical protein L0215_07435, partial [Gemmataceae bacterium]|nr:hypothetical protein [Gemmataceae bacterium]